MIASTLLLDVSALLRQLTASPALSGAPAAMSTQAKLGYARATLSVLLTFGISEGIDGICTESLAISTSPSSVGLDGCVPSLLRFISGKPPASLVH